MTQKTMVRMSMTQVSYTLFMSFSHALHPCGFSISTEPCLAAYNNVRYALHFVY